MKTIEEVLKGLDYRRTSLYQQIKLCEEIDGKHIMAELDARLDEVESLIEYITYGDYDEGN